jgi:hypothetical protein
MVEDAKAVLVLVYGVVDDLVGDFTAQWVVYD